ncbi:HlyD family type I secretion periplasmic adaptor subunit [Ruegeria atlantica]|uniref:HlyD family type I secretion periplasmic adaptor subunit n=1 Tax=Ruegeria atlantica TaxID=81569 RepID=UPI001480B6C4|nr:HlyD family type I secretion periplasmic adaptor subunit [Ruegeria atlantica]
MTAHPTKQWKATGTILVGAATLVVLFGALGVWGVQARIDGAIIAQGMTQVESNRQIVQHPDGGVVGALHVKDGDWVVAGDVLLTFEDEFIRSELTTVEGQLFEIVARKARLAAERDGLATLKISPSLVAYLEEAPEIKELLNDQQQLLDVRRQAQAENEAQITEQISQANHQIEGAEAQLAAIQRQSELILGELENVRVLFEEKLTPASRLSSLQREDARLIGEQGTTLASIAQLKGQIAALNIQLISLKTQRREEAISTLRDLEVREIELVQRRLDLKRTLSRVEVRAPVDGVVFGSRVFAVRAVVSAAEPILFVIPQDQPLVISARVEPIHVDQVLINQEATLRFTSFDQRFTPELKGTVVGVSADIHQDEATGFPYYRVEIVPDDGEISKLGDNTLIPGMPVESLIKTGARSPLNYLTKPLTDYFVRSFRES